MKRGILPVMEELQVAADEMTNVALAAATMEVEEAKMETWRWLQTDGQKQLELSYH